VTAHELVKWVNKSRSRRAIAEFLVRVGLEGARLKPTTATPIN
jgi:hypothetical protein